MTDHDTRKQIEEDARRIVHSGYVSVNDVERWLDRQAAITRREYGGVDWLAHVESLQDERDELQAKLDQCMESYADAKSSRDELQAKLEEYDETHIALPLDADGVPISMGDAVSRGSDKFIAFTLHDGYVFRECGFKNGRYIVEAYEADELRHVKPRMVEDVLAEFAGDVRNGKWSLDMEQKYADELRELMEVGE